MPQIELYIYYVQKIDVKLIHHFRISCNNTYVKFLESQFQHLKVFILSLDITEFISCFKLMICFFLCLILAIPDNCVDVDSSSIVTTAGDAICETCASGYTPDDGDATTCISKSQPASFCLTIE